ncbi:hypothetical protein [uncultured Martelella sp.]|uniref:hypothetical protein n=1 Tax=uncultured Martelella sp. TaxID=392331 RepID=UPI0029C86A32|nr:hypothetical protein [uncultured Martelella sp.]
MSDDIKPFARFDSRWLAAMHEFSRHQRRQAPYCTHVLTHRGNIIIEPAPAGGVYIAAACRHGVAVVHDPDGRATGPMTIMFPDAAYEAARRRERIAMTYCGERHEFEAPEWMQPGDIFCAEHFAFITPRMIPPRFAADWPEELPLETPALYATSIAHDHQGIVIGESYKVTEGAVVDWRIALDEALQNEPAARAGFTCGPDIFALMKPLIKEIALRLQKWPATTYRLSPTKKGPVLMQVDGFADAIAMFTEQAADEPELAAHFREEAE